MLMGGDEVAIGPGGYLWKIKNLLMRVILQHY